MGSNPPTASEYYRIQNAEYATFLEVSKVYDGAVVVLRPQKSFVEKQQWVFLPGTTSDTYKIKSVPSIREPPELYLFADDTGAVIVTGEAKEATDWFVRFEKNGEECSIKSRDPKSSRRYKFLYVNDSGELCISTSQDASFNVNNADDTYKWNLIKVWSSLAQDKYRVRSITGKALRMNADKSLAVDTQESQSNDTWEFDPKSNGTFELKNVDLSAFLISTRSSSTENLEIVKADDKPAIWQLQRIGDFAWSISVTVDYFKIPLALTFLEDNSQVVLKPLKNARNQIWFFELVDATGFTPGPPPPPYDGRRYSEITEGYWAVASSAYTSPYRYLYSDGTTPYRWKTYSYATLGAYAYAFRITYIGDTGSFYMTMYNNPGIYGAPGPSPQLNTLEAGNIPHRWALEQESDPSGGFRYCIRSLSTQKVISAATVRDVNGYDNFALANRALGDVNQLWKLYKISS